MTKRDKQKIAEAMNPNFISRVAVVEELYKRAAEQFMLGHDETAIALRSVAQHFDLGGVYVRNG